MTLTINKIKNYATELDVKEISYDINYFNNYKSYEGSSIDKRLMKCRADMVKACCSPKDNILDFGCGTGQFIKKIANSYYMVYGWDVMIKSKEWLRKNFILLNPFYDSMLDINAVCFWDSLEHLKDPSIILNLLPEGCHVFISIPIFDDLDKIKQSKHYKPGEHYWYFTHKGLIDYMWLLKYEYLGYTDCEIKVGRENIYSYTFIKKLNASLF